MSKSIFTTVAVASFALASCSPPPVVPSPLFTPNPPYPPQQVDPYGQTSNPDGTSPDPYGQTTAPASQSEPSVRPGEYPTARKTANPNEVISPYEPYNVIDVEGFSSGQLARDPSNQKIFRVP